jgi:hypothetical protein
MEERSMADGAISRRILTELTIRAGAALAAGRRSFYRFVDLGYDDALTASLDEFRRMFEGA